MLPTLQHKPRKCKVLNKYKTLCVKSATRETGALRKKLHAQQPRSNAPVVASHPLCNNKPCLNPHNNNRRNLHSPRAQTRVSDNVTHERLKTPKPLRQPQHMQPPKPQHVNHAQHRRPKSSHPSNAR
jgi:hypothetical protein